MMGYAFYFAGGRPAGYGVVATCDRRGCGAEIDRGLGYLCGTEPHRPVDDAAGCGFYFCGDHLGWVGPRGGCSHRQTRPWGTTLACMASRTLLSEGSVFCLYRVGHAGAHAFDDQSPA